MRKPFWGWPTRRLLFYSRAWPFKLPLGRGWFVGRAKRLKLKKEEKLRGEFEDYAITIIAPSTGAPAPLQKRKSSWGQPTLFAQNANKGGAPRIISVKTWPPQFSSASLSGSVG